MKNLTSIVEINSINKLFNGLQDNLVRRLLKANILGFITDMVDDVITSRLVRGINVSNMQRELDPHNLYPAVYHTCMLCVGDVSNDYEEIMALSSELTDRVLTAMTDIITKISLQFIPQLDNSPSSDVVSKICCKTTLIEDYAIRISLSIE